MLFTISGPSAVGKDTVIDIIINQYPYINKVITHTTRLPREEEKDGIDYHFTSQEEFDALEKKSFFAETKTIYGERYGLSKKEVEKAIKSEKPVLANIDVLGAIEISEMYPQAISIILLPKSNTELKKRLSQRGPIEPSRLERVEMELSKAKLFDYQIINEELGDTVNKIISIIKGHTSDI